MTTPPHSSAPSGVGGLGDQKEKRDENTMEERVV